MFKRTLIAAIAAATLSTGALASNETFESLKGIEADQLTAVELEGIQGQITFTQLVDAIKASKWYAANTASGDKLIAYITTLYNKYPKFWDKLLAFVKLPPLK